MGRHETHGTATKRMAPPQNARHHHETAPPKEGGTSLALERLGLVSNAGALLQAGQLTGDAYLALLTQLAVDASPTLLDALLDAHETLRTTFITEDLQETYAAYLRQTFGPSLEGLGLEPRDSDEGVVRAVRGRLFLLLGDAGRACDLRLQARKMVDAFLAGKAIPPELLSPALELAALEGDTELFEKYSSRFKTAEPMHHRSLVEGMAAFPNDASRKRLLNEFLTGDMGLNEFILVAFALGNKDTTAPLVLRWLEENYAALAESLPPFAMPFLPEISAGRCSTDHLAAVETFFLKPRHRFGGTEDQVNRVAGRVRDCANLRQREGLAVARFLAKNKP